MHEVVENAYWSLHMGTWLGPIGKAATFVGGLVSTSLPITGFLIWWGRRKKKKRGFTGAMKDAKRKEKQTVVFKPRTVVKVNG